MPLAKWFKNIENTFAWSFIGVLLAIAFGTVGLYSILHENKPDISFEIVTESNVLDIRQPLKDLSILFRGEDIQEKDLNLRIFIIRIENNRQVDILQNHYDVDDIWGFQVENGKIIEARLVNTNSDYLKSKLNPQVYKDNIVQLKKIIFERGKYFILEVLVLHKKSIPPEIISLGKIAGINRINPIKSWLGKSKHTILGEFFYGSLLIQILRPISYLIAGVILLIVVLLGGEQLSEVRLKRKKALRKKQIDTILKIKNVQEGSKGKIPYDIYIEQGPESIKTLRAMLEKEEKLLIEMKEYQLRKEFREKLSELKKGEQSVEGGELDLIKEIPGMIPEFGEVIISPIHYISNPLIEDLIKNDILTVEKDNKIIVNTEFKQALNDLLRYLEAKKKK